MAGHRRERLIGLGESKAGLPRARFERSGIIVVATDPSSKIALEEALKPKKFEGPSLLDILKPSNPLELLQTSPETTPDNEQTKGTGDSKSS